VNPWTAAKSRSARVRISIKCAATAADGHNSVAMLVRREGETLNALLKRLDKAIGRYFDGDEFIDEINGT
jgi:hypothetical protein